MEQCDVLIIGSGIAGLTAALELAKKNLKVFVISSEASPQGSNSFLAQGGIVYRGKDDSAEALIKDIETAGDGLCDQEAVLQLSLKGPDCVEEILINEVEVPFDRNDDGSLSYTREAAHSLSRIVHHKDCTGNAIISALFERLNKETSVRFFFSHRAFELIYDGKCHGAYVLDQKSGELISFFAKKTMLATGGVGGLFFHTSNQDSALGDGIAMASRIGAKLKNLEYVQFHPTALYGNQKKRFLLTEALRGEGAVLLDASFLPFMHKYDKRKCLASRDIVSRSIFEEMRKSNKQHLWLDISFKKPSWVKDRFPTIFQGCLEEGYDVTQGPVPIVPVAHFSCGGIEVDLKGRTSVASLYAIGEVACTGVHGANRLASTSLLEALLWAKVSAQDIAQNLSECQCDGFKMVSLGQDPKEPMPWDYLRNIMWEHVGIVRTKQGLETAIGLLGDLKEKVSSHQRSAKVWGFQNALETAILIARTAVENGVSKGCHFIQS